MCVCVIFKNKAIATWGKNGIIISKYVPLLLHLNVRFRAECVGLHDSKGVVFLPSLTQGEMPGHQGGTVFPCAKY